MLRFFIKEEIDKENLRNYVKNPTAEMWEKVKHIKRANLKTGIPQFIGQMH